jgi:uncharacterized membrane protein YfcA
MNTGTELWLFAVSLGASALGGMLGMASGIFIVPVLTMFGHVDIRSAIGASIVSVIACSCSGAAPFLKGRLTNVRLAIVLEFSRFRPWTRRCACQLRFRQQPRIS